MLRRIGHLAVLNPGSLGQPRDGDPRASYAVIENGVPRLMRVPYDIDRTVADLRRMPIPPDAVEALTSILRAGKT